MDGWWNNLSGLNQTFFGIATFFSVFFVWQLIAALMGLSGDEMDASDAGDAHVDGDLEADVDSHDGHLTADDTMVSFKLLSVRSLITFCTLFSWGMALYLQRGDSVGLAMLFSCIWGLVGMVSVALVFYLMKRMSESGTKNLDTAVGAEGIVYLDIPADGEGEIRVTVSDVVSYVKARGANGVALKAGAPVKVVRRLGPSGLEVRSLDV